MDDVGGFTRQQARRVRSMLRTHKHTHAAPQTDTSEIPTVICWTVRRSSNNNNNNNNCDCNIINVRSTNLNASWPTFAVHIAGASLDSAARSDVRVRMRRRMQSGMRPPVGCKVNLCDIYGYPLSELNTMRHVHWIAAIRECSRKWRMGALANTQLHEHECNT